MLRDDREALIAKNETLEAEKRELERKLSEKQEKKPEPPRQGPGESTAGTFMEDLFTAGATMAACILFLVVVVAGLLALRSMHDDMAARDLLDAKAAHRQAIKEHKQMLVRLHTEVPAGVDPGLWNWCVDHCARMTNRDYRGARYREGVITGEILDHTYGEPGYYIVNIEGVTVSNSHDHPNQETIHLSGGNRMQPEEAEPSIGQLVAVYHGDGHLMIEPITREISMERAREREQR